VVNRLVAERLFGSAADAIGRQITMPYFTGDIVATVVGVVEPIRYDDLVADLRPEVYLPTGQGTVVPLSLVYRTSGNPAALVPSIRSAVAEVDATSSVALDEIATLDSRLARTVARPRFFLVLVCVFAALAAALATCGVYGTTSYWLAESRREIGLRLALGATPRQVRRQVTARGVGMALLGVVVGLAGFALASGLVSHLLVGFDSIHPPTLLAAGAALAACGLAATWWPARRVSAVDPAEMLRE
jgi:predicted lysophospholipase L1 biosynthesis ABC-type transport system permease subunit